MQEYDVALKLLLRGSAQFTVRELTGASVETWIDVELPKIQNLRVEFKRGVQEGELTVLRRQIEKRFGALPSWAEERLAGRTTTELEELSIRVLDAQNLEELLK